MDESFVEGLNTAIIAGVLVFIALIGLFVLVFLTRGTYILIRIQTRQLKQANAELTTAKKVVRELKQNNQHLRELIALAKDPEGSPADASSSAAPPREDPGSVGVNLELD
ncbi:MAG: hypothetical protein AAF514_08815 [Verrucomicrobiota bacterium]